MEKEKLKEILHLHKLWLEGSNEGERANLQNADLWNADLWNANLQNANLRNTNLQNANLRNANLQNANLRNANLQDADLWNADLWNADLWNANLQDADLWNADLWNADLWNANLQNANLRGITTESIRNLNVISAQLNTSEKNRKVTYWVDLDVVTAGCWQSNWEEFKKRVADVYGENEKMKRKYDRVIKFIEDEVAEEKDK
ncbi:pentapeptide repeat-containing protein [Marinilactibacillus psychrotolerans]|uniref:Pentapeptide repeat-containing protein n=1 Tax=Marinilactibacillus psychrotolerans TaxID=191770 RepID=A0A5R9C455_9LACT|nr:pentapeptide repeat-containing protein [Marinilactibacillus psychrotolerans]TLQ07602.1 pentapeptide repeat-containing protein [Marinilactibacillus psychrotolerans]